MHVHSVYFTLIDKSDEKKQAVIDDANTYLAGLDGVLSLVCGVLAVELNREVNDQDFDVALHVQFKDQAAHDAYQVHPDHDIFVANNKDNWSQVRVFDSVVDA